MRITLATGQNVSSIEMTPQRMGAELAGVDLDKMTMIQTNKPTAHAPRAKAAMKLGM